MKPAEWCMERGISTNELIRFMQSKFPKYSHPTNTMANHPEKYGVCLSPAAEKHLSGRGEKPKEFRRKPRRFNFRLSLDDAAKFDRARTLCGYSIQEASEYAVSLFVEEVNDVRNSR